MPDFTRASAIPRTKSWLTLQANLFQVFQPIGGVRARLLATAGAGLSAAHNAVAPSSHPTTAIRTRVLDFMIVPAGTICIRGTTTDATEIRRGWLAPRKPGTLAGSEKRGRLLKENGSPC